MGRVQDRSDAKMSGKQRPQSERSDVTQAGNKKRKTGQEKSQNENTGGGGEPTPSKDRRTWTQKEEFELVKVLVTHTTQGRVIPMQSKTATYWTELITVLYPGEKGITQRRLYDKVRRMHLRHNEIKQLLLEKKENPWKNTHEKALCDFWDQIFDGETMTNVRRAAQEPLARAVKATNGNSVKVVQVTETSSEEDEEEEDHEEVRVPTVKVAPPAQVPVRAAPSESEEEDDEDESSPEKRHVPPSVHIGARAEATRIPYEELRRAPSLSRQEILHKAGVKSGPTEIGGKEKLVTKDHMQNVGNVRKKRKDAEEAVLDADSVESLKAELFEYVQKLRDDCMRELDEVKNQLMSPVRLLSARKRQAFALEELSLQEEELEISRRYCNLQREALKLQNAS